MIMYLLLLELIKMGDDCHNLVRGSKENVLGKMLSELNGNNIAYLLCNS